MKHWDLTPGESVTVRSRGRVFVGRFLFRTTVIAAFEGREYTGSRYSTRAKSKARFTANSNLGETAA